MLSANSGVKFFSSRNTGASGPFSRLYIPDVQAKVTLYKNILLLTQKWCRVSHFFNTELKKVGNIEPTMYCSVGLNLKCHWTSFKQTGLTNVFDYALIALIYLLVMVVSQQVFVGTLRVCRETSVKVGTSCTVFMCPLKEKKQTGIFSAINKEADVTGLLCIGVHV